MHNFSKRDIAEGKQFLSKKLVRTVLFSEGTYQVEVAKASGSKETLWPFLQLSDEGQVLDAFCSCEKAEEMGSCPHLAAAFYKIMKIEPLHVRFRESFWNQMCLICAHRYGYDVKLLKKSKDGVEAVSQAGILGFKLRIKSSKGEKHLRELLYKRPIETEETSLKFSNLSSEELALWREGRPSEQLSYELSFWSDLAKWWMLLQENQEKYSLKFSEESPPEKLSVDFPDFSIECQILKSEWPSLIESLKTVDSPLKVYSQTKGRLEKVVFHPDSGGFSLEISEDETIHTAPKKGGCYC